MKKIVTAFSVLLATTSLSFGSNLVQSSDSEDGAGSATSEAEDTAAELQAAIEEIETKNAARKARLQAAKDKAASTEESAVIEPGLSAQVPAGSTNAASTATPVQPQQAGPVFEKAASAQAAKIPAKKAPSKRVNRR